MPSRKNNPIMSSIIKPLTAHRLNALPPYPFAELERKISEKLARGEDVINLGIGDPDLPPPKFFTEALQKHATDMDTHFYPTSQGNPGVRKEIARFFQGRFGVELNPDTQICVVIGAKEGLANFGRAYVNPGDEVGVPSPSYPVYGAGVATLCDAHARTIPLREDNGFLPDLKDAEGVRMAFFNYPNNPTGAIAPEPFWKQLGDFCDTHPETIVVHDHAYSEMTFDKYVAPSLLQFTPNALEIHSISKVFNATGFRIGFAVGREDYIAALVKTKSQVDSGAPLMIQRAMAEGLARYMGATPPPEVSTLRKTYGERRAFAEQALEKMNLKVTRSPATFYVWVHIGANEMDFVNAALNKNVVVTPGRAFGLLGTGFIRLALTQPLERIQEAMERLATI
jgi:LL-diaminopimelate aminotransferase